MPMHFCHTFTLLSLSIALYLEGGIHTMEIGSVMFGLQPDGTEVPAKNELGRWNNRECFGFLMEGWLFGCLVVW